MSGILLFGRQRRPGTVLPGLVALGFAAILMTHPATLGAQEYTVAEGDVLQITVYNNPELATTARVGAEGRIKFPLVGEVLVKDLTATRIADVIAAKLANGYLIDPQVSVTVQEYRLKRANMLGKVSRPGVFEFRGVLTLLELLSRAGGPTPDAGSQAVIRRRGQAGESLTIDLRRLLLGGSTELDVEIQDGDMVIVGEAGAFMITGEVRRPGEYRFEEGITLRRAITVGGGFTERAATDHVKVIREAQDGERVFEGGMGASDPEVVLHRGDIVVVSVQRTEVCYVTGEVKSAGAYRCEPGTSVLKVVTLAGGFTDAAARNKVRVIRTVNGQEVIRDRVPLEEPVLPEDVIVVPRTFF